VRETVNKMAIDTLYQGSVKNLLGPLLVKGSPCIIFDYTDSFSVFDWGKMPDVLPGKGQALAVLAAELFEKLERCETWQEFANSSEALNLRKTNRFGPEFEQVGRELQHEGLKTHYRGFLHSLPDDQNVAAPLKISHSEEAVDPFRYLVVQQVSVIKPAFDTVLGQVVPDYQKTRNSRSPRLVPLEVVFRFSIPDGSSLLSRVNRDPDYLSSLGYSDVHITPGAKWGFPVLELFTKLETTDRPVSYSEALAISGLSARSLQQILFKTVWVASLMNWLCSKVGLELADGKLEWAISENGDCILVDAIGPDELRILKNGVQLSKEFLRSFYRSSRWYSSVETAKSEAKRQGLLDWKKLVREEPPRLPSEYSKLGTQIYFALANVLTGKRWFDQAWEMEKVVTELKKLQQGGSI
jgi:phosphoribosylaminoimidazole-succinocarboxamide synthase